MSSEKPAEAKGVVCPTCGERFDPAELDAVLYHSQVPHKPVPATGVRGKRIK
jgi:hypothetical protein